MNDSHPSNRSDKQSLGPISPSADARASPFRCIQHSNDTMALAISVDALSAFDPFGHVPLRLIVPMLRGQIKRKHYLITVRGGQVCGYVGWGMCEEDQAEKWSRGSFDISHEQCLSGDCITLFVFCASSPAASRLQISALRERYDGRRWIGMRHKGETIRPMKGRFDARHR